MCIKPAKSFWMRALALIGGRRHGPDAAPPPDKPAAPEPNSTPAAHATGDNCDSCIFRAPGVASLPPLCRPRNFSIVRPAHTWCKNFASRDPSPQGAIHHIWPDHTRSPWMGLIAPHVAAGTCVVCGRKSKDGIGIDLLEGSVRTCGVEHYLAWWVSYQEQRLAFFKHTGEKILRDFDDLVSVSSAAVSYNDAREAFQDAIAVARDLERIDEVHILEARIEYIRHLSESQSS